MSLTALMAEELASGLTGNSLQTCSRWSSKRRVMGHPFPGPYSTKYHPWAREILDSTAPFNVTLKSAQGGFTEIGINVAFYTLDIKKRDVLYVLPTSLNAADFSKARFGGALEASPYIKSMFSDINTVGLKRAGANNLYIRGSKGKSNLKSVPASVLILDEYDEFDQEAVALALERLSGQIEKQVWYISTPTIPQYGVHREFLLSTQEHYFFPCPSCSKQTELVWPDCVEIIGDDVNDPRCKESYLKCKECKAKLEHLDKPNWLGKGKWQPTVNTGTKDRRGFHINQIYSLTVSPGELVQAYHRGRCDEYAACEFQRSKLGLPWIGEGAQINDGHIINCTKDFLNNTLFPTRNRPIITMGYDQGKTGYYSVVEWKITGSMKNANNNAIGKLIGFGRVDQNSLGLSRLEELMSEWQVLYCVLDADPEIGLARTFCKKFRKFAAISRYRKGVTGNELSISDVDTDAPLITADRTYWLSMALGRFKTERIEVPRDLSTEYKDHIKAMVQTFEKDEKNNPFATYVSTGADHYAHSLCYSEIALTQVPGVGGGNITNI